MMRAALLNCFVVIVSAAGADEEGAGRRELHVAAREARGFDTESQPHPE